MKKLMLATEELVMRVFSDACLLAISRQVNTVKVWHAFIIITIGEVSVGENQCSQRRSFYPQIKMIGLAGTLVSLVRNRSDSAFMSSKTSNIKDSCLKTANHDFHTHLSAVASIV